MELERHVPGRGLPRRATSEGDLQAPQGRTAAVGLPRRPVPPRGRRVRAQRRPRMGARPSHDRPRGGPARRRLAAGLRRRRLRAALLHTARGRGPPRSVPQDGRVRLRRQQHRPQERSLPRRHRWSHLGHRQRVVVPRRLQAPHRHLGLRWRAPRPDLAGRPRPPGHRRPPGPLAELLGAFERDAVLARARALVRNGELPTDPSGSATPGRSSDAETRRGPGRSRGLVHIRVPARRRTGEGPSGRSAPRGGPGAPCARRPRCRGRRSRRSGPRRPC